MSLKKRYLSYMVLPFLLLGCGVSENNEVKSVIDQNSTFVNQVDVSIEEVLLSGNIQNISENQLIVEIQSEIGQLYVEGKYPKQTFTSSKYSAIHKMLKHFKKNDYHFDWSNCNNNEDCNNVEGLYSEFEEGALAVKEMLSMLEINKIDIFEETGYRLEKLLVLLGDKFRQTVKFPMDKVDTNDNEFMRSYYADHTVYNYRKFNPVQPDMGNFSRSDFSHIIRVNRRVQMLSKRNFASTGAYAIPGETVKIIRKDNSNVSVKVFINTVKSGATHQYAKYGYSRPKYLKTPYYELHPNETILLTSPYGGPIELAFNSNEQAVDIVFENVGEHPYWSNRKDNDSFMKKLKRGAFDWAEVATSDFEVHSTIEKMKSTMVQWGSPFALVEAIGEYTVNYPHQLAGYQGAVIEPVEEILDFAILHDLPMKEYMIKKHMNADQASCGLGCSGNPYDAYWAFSPIGYNDLHELGHGLEKGVFRFDGFEKHASTNPYAFYTISQYNKYHENENLTCEALPFEKMYDVLKESKKQKDPQAYLKDVLWEKSHWQEQFMITLQAMMHVQKMKKLDDGWHLLSRLHLLERERKHATTEWESRKYAIGFDTYSVKEFKQISNNDWMLISLSVASGLDFRNFLSMYGLVYSEKAAKQVESFVFPSMPKKFFLSTPTGYCEVDQYGDYLDKRLEKI